MGPQKWVVFSPVGEDQNACNLLESPALCLTALMIKISRALSRAEVAEDSVRWQQASLDSFDLEVKFGGEGELPVH